MGHNKPRQSASLRKSTPTTTIPTRQNAKSPTGIGPIVEQEPPGMASSFLQYCATCEREFFTPNNSILYCSEACRRKDSSKPLSLCADVMTPTTMPPDSASDSPRPILPSRIPTGASYSSTSSSSSSSRIPPELHSATPDLDPTEWKPKLHRRGVSINSEAFRYLSRFHQPTANEENQAIERIRKPDLTRDLHCSTTSIASLATSTTHSPSLSLTPTTAASSLSASIDHTSAKYDFNTRPLPPRHDPTYSSSAGANKGIELVMPHVAPAATPAMVGSAPDHIHFHGGVWEKQTVKKLPESVARDAKEGLGALFEGAAEKK